MGFQSTVFGMLALLHDLDLAVEGFLNAAMSLVEPPYFSWPTANCSQNRLTSLVCNGLLPDSVGI